MNTDKLIQQAKKTWPTVLAESGIECTLENSDLIPIKAISAPNVQRVVMIVRTDEVSRYIYKFEPNLDQAEHHNKSVSAHRRIEGFISVNSDNKVPRLIWSSEKLGVQLFEYISGPTAESRLDWAPSPKQVRNEILRDCGSWLAALHKSSAANDTSVPNLNGLKWPAKVARTRAASIRNGELHVAAHKMFLGLCAMMHRLCRGTEGHAITRAELHGDPHIGNFIYGSDGFYSIDVPGRGVGAVEIDVARLMTRLRYKFQTHSECIDLAGLSSEDWESFAEGYGRDLRQSPILVTCIAFQVLQDWSDILPRDIAKAHLYDIRFSAIKTIFKSLKEAGY